MKDKTMTIIILTILLFSFCSSWLLWQDPEVQEGYQRITKRTIPLTKAEKESRQRAYYYYNSILTPTDDPCHPMIYTRVECEKDKNEE